MRENAQLFVIYRFPIETKTVALQETLATVARRSGCLIWDKLCHFFVLTVFSELRRAFGAVMKCGSTVASFLLAERVRWTSDPILGIG